MCMIQNQNLNEWWRVTILLNFSCFIDYTCLHTTILIDKGFHAETSLNLSSWLYSNHVLSLTERFAWGQNFLYFISSFFCVTATLDSSSLFIVKVFFSLSPVLQLSFFLFFVICAYFLTIFQFVTDVMKPLRMDDIMDQEVQNLSGGELQRVALALCLGQPADVYLIDEPSAYLDSEQRLVAAKVIKRWNKYEAKTVFEF